MRLADVDIACDPSDGWIRCGCPKNEVASDNGARIFKSEPMSGLAGLLVPLFGFVDACRCALTRTSVESDFTLRRVFGIIAYLRFSYCHFLNNSLVRSNSGATCHVLAEHAASYQNISPFTHLDTTQLEETHVVVTV